MKATNRIGTALAVALFLGVSIFLTVHATAGLLRWSVETEPDPFSKGGRVTASFSSSVRSGVLLFYDSAKSGMELRAIAGWRMSDADFLALSSLPLKASIAIDGEVLLTDLDVVPGQCGNSIACASIKLDSAASAAVIRAFVSARRQIAIKDGISDRPHLLTARGSTKSARALQRCLDGQKKGEIQ